MMRRIVFLILIVSSLVIAYRQGVINERHRWQQNIEVQICK